MKKELSQTDFYTKKAKEENYPARSVYKLKEIDKKFRLFKAGDKVLDLGSSPGSWMLYISERVGARGKVVGIDINELRIELKENMLFYRQSIFENIEFKEKFQTIVSDLAPKTTGMKEKDAADSLSLAKKAFEIAEDVLLEGGSFVCKVFESEEANEFLKELKNSFEAVKRYRPKAVLKQSREFFIVALTYL